LHGGHPTLSTLICISTLPPALSPSLPPSLPVSPPSVRPFLSLSLSLSLSLRYIYFGLLSLYSILANPCGDDACDFPLDAYQVIYIYMNYIYIICDISVICPSDFPLDAYWVI
jgi:hypothetical protein